MPGRLFSFDPPDRFIAGTIGQPGNRTFFLQARRAGQIVSVVLEKVQVAVLAERLGILLDELEARGVTMASDGVMTDTGPLDEPINETFRATTLTLGWDGDAEQILVEARAEAEDDDEEVAADDDDNDEDEDEAIIDLSSVEGLAGSPAGELLAAFEGIDEDDEDSPDVLRVRMTADAARGFVNRALEVVSAGRMPCPLCGQPLDPQGHICPRRNGHYVN
ncbi:MAG: hypothetical protein QOF49_1410 [Chloroflexota bacterium]|jgi:uncharacterized repeat protein (TIGR03847 family)|nr:hypothetical protein [Chloroflexota bacterium]